MTSSSFLSLFFILIIFTIKLKVAIAGGAVNDTNGKALDIASEYSILTPEINGGGVTVASNVVKNQLVVVLSIKPLPVNFSDSEGTKVILTNENIKIEFASIPKYNGSSSWIVVNDESAKVWYVAVGSAKNYPNNQIQTGTFKIKPHSFGYKLFFCSDVSNSFCKEVGIYTDKHGNDRLALNGTILLIKFQKKL